LLEALPAAIAEADGVAIFDHLEPEVYRLREQAELRDRFLLNQQPPRRPFNDDTGLHIGHEAGNLFVVGKNGAREVRRLRDVESRAHQIGAALLAHADVRGRQRSRDRRDR